MLSDLTGARVRLRAEEERDTEVAGALRRVLPGCESAAGERLVVERRSDGGAVGFVEFRRDDPEKGWATVGAIAMADGERGWGYGSEAVRTIERHLEETAGARSFRAAVSKEIGLAFYFWLRQGYRPAVQEERWSGEGGGDIIWMVREEPRDQSPEPGVRS